MTRSSQATAITNGFEFQKYAGIYLMLKTFDSFKTLKIEGEKQDIEIEKDNGLFLFVQAKSAEKPYDITGPKTKTRFKEAIDSFKKINSLKDGDDLVYINNFEQRNPFGVEWNQFKNPYYYRYRELPQFVKDAVDVVSGVSDIEKEKLVFAGLSFYGEDAETKTKQIADKAKEILASIDNSLLPHTQSLLDSWVAQFGINSTSRNNKITKDSIASDLTYFALKGAEELPGALSDLNIPGLDWVQATNSYGRLIDRKGLGFKEYNAIAKDYLNKMDVNPNIAIHEYIITNLDNIIKILSLDTEDIPENIKKTVAKIIAYKLIVRSSKLGEIYKKLRNG